MAITSVAQFQRNLVRGSFFVSIQSCHCWLKGEDSDCLQRHAFTFIEHIDLSRNDFTGTFPLFLGDLRYLGKLACLQLHS